MLEKIKQFFNQELHLDEQASREHKLQQACAVLLTEVGRADYEETRLERNAIKTALSQKFSLTEDKLEHLLSLGESQENESTSLYPFTALINDKYDYNSKVELIQMMWNVASADGEISMYEDHMVRKIADLLYVSHSDFIQTKLNSAQAQ